MTHVHSGGNKSSQNRKQILSRNVPSCSQLLFVRIKLFVSLEEEESGTSRSKEQDSLTTREVDIGAEQEPAGGFAKGGIWCCLVSRGEDKERCTVSCRPTSTRNDGVCFVN